MSGRRPSFFLLVFVYLAAVAVVRTPRSDDHGFSGDGAYYYGTLRSLVIDGNWTLLEEFGSEEYLEANALTRLHLTPEEWERYRQMLLTTFGWTPERFEFEKDLLLEKMKRFTLEEHREGLLVNERGPPNDFPAGYALLSLPFYLAVHWIMGPGDGSECPAGYEFQYRLAVNLGSAFYAALGMVITLLLLERFLPGRTALVAAVTTLLATNLTWFVGPITSHVVAFFSTALFLLLTLRLQDDTSSLRRWAATGAAAGLMLLCRPQNGTFLVLPLLLAPRLFRRDDLLGSLQGLLVAAVCALFAFSFQFAYWWAYYEQVLHVPKSGYLQWHAVFANYPKVFVGHNGMFKTHPLTVLATIGLLLFAARRFSLGAALIIAFLLHTMASAAAPDWWGAHPESPIGNRRFDGCLPLFALGFGAILEQTLRNRRVFLPATILFIAFGIAEQCWYWTRP